MKNMDRQTNRVIPTLYIPRETLFAGGIINDSESYSYNNVSQVQEL